MAREKDQERILSFLCLSPNWVIFLCSKQLAEMCGQRKGLELGVLLCRHLGGSPPSAGLQPRLGLGVAKGRGLVYSRWVAARAFDH